MFYLTPLTLIGEGVGMGSPKIKNLVKYVVYRPAGTDLPINMKFGIEEHQRFTVACQIPPRLVKGMGGIPTHPFTSGMLIGHFSLAVTVEAL